MEASEKLIKQSDEKIGSMELQERMNNNFKKIQKSFYINLLALITFLVVQVIILCKVQKIHRLGVTVLVLSILCLLLEAYSYLQQRWMKTQKLIITEFSIIFLEALIVGISVYQIMDGALDRDGIKTAVFQIIMIFIFTGVSFYKLFPAVQLHRAYEQYQQKWNLPDRFADETYQKNGI